MLLQAVQEFASDYLELLDRDPIVTREQLEEAAQCFVGDHPSLEIKDLQDFQYDPNPVFYRALLDVLQRCPTLDIRHQASVAYCGWRRRHTDPRSVLPTLSLLVRNTAVSPGTRSTAAYELAQAERTLGHNGKAIEWLLTSTAAAEEAGNRLQRLMNQAVAASWEAETSPKSAEPTIRDLRAQFVLLAEDKTSPDRETARRWVMNTTYHLAKIAAGTGDEDELEEHLGLLEQPEYRELNWITEDQLTELRAAL
ncbi:hypothetical protein HYZ98_04375 [Candidatus Peregrinibacteria bacterium]|nr:hypothetical protein [Candidatus Peregrinibacteria bacterium]